MGIVSQKHAIRLWQTEHKQAPEARDFDSLRTKKHGQQDTVHKGIDTVKVKPDALILGIDRDVYEYSSQV